jgi:hypothetical protein
LQLSRPLRPTSADVVCHVLNRANGRMTLFDDDDDYAAFDWKKKVSATVLTIDLLGQTEFQNCFSASC